MTTLKKRVKLQQLEFERDADRLNTLLGSSRNHVDRNALFWAVVTSAFVGGVLARRLTPSVSPQKAVRRMVLFQNLLG